MQTTNREFQKLIRDFFSVFPESLLGVFDEILSFPSVLLTLIKDISSPARPLSENSISLIKNSYVHETAYVGDFTLIRNSYIAANCRIGSHVEINNSIVLDTTVIPHHNYIGYSIVGSNVVLGGNTRTAVRRLDERYPSISINNVRYYSKCKKFGSFIGDFSKVGSTVVLNPMTILGRNVIIQPNLSISGYFPDKAKIENKAIVRGSDIMKKSDR